MIEDLYLERMLEVCVEDEFTVRVYVIDVQNLTATGAVIDIKSTYTTCGMMEQLEPR